MKQLVLASHNAHKLVELKQILEPHLPGIELIGYDGPEPRETGATFAQNATLKAAAAAKHTGLPAIADDSGLAVDVMGGSPGIFSARWSGTKSDQANLELLLKQLQDIAEPLRGAEFVCAAALVTPDGKTEVELGRWRGKVLDSPRGEAGFGYDPLFMPEGQTKSAAELTSAQKNKDSHRTKAFMALAPKIIAQI